MAPPSGPARRRTAAVRALLGLACLLLAAATACSAPVPVASTPAPAYLRVGGSSSMAPALQELAAAFSARRPELTVDVQASNTSAGLAALAEGRVDVAMASWQPAEPPAGLQWVSIGQDGIALIVHPRNKVEDLSLVKVQELFAGWHADWSELSETGGPIEVVSREGGAGTREAWEAGVMAGHAVTPAAVVMPSSAGVAEWVATHPSAVGYISASQVTDGVRVVSIDGEEPTAESVAAGEYPLRRPLFLVTAPASDRLAEEFVRFCSSPAGQEIVGKYHLPAGE